MSFAASLQAPVDRSWLISILLAMHLFQILEETSPIPEWLDGATIFWARERSDVLCHMSSVLGLSLMSRLIQMLKDDAFQLGIAAECLAMSTLSICTDYLAFCLSLDQLFCPNMCVPPQDTCKGMRVCP